MMQKRTLYSLLLISFIAVLSASSVFANQVIIQSKNAERCDQTVLNVSTTVSSDSVSAVEVVVEISGAFTGVPSVSFDPGLTELDNRVIDLTQANGVSPDTIRFAAMRTDPSDATLKAGTKVFARITLGTANACAGTINVNNGIFSYPNPVGVVTTQFVNAANATLLAVAVTNGVVTLVNNPPVLASIPDATLPWGGLYVGSASATDADTSACEKLQYSKVSGPGPMTVNANTGAISWLTNGNDVCTHSVIIQVTDSCGATDRDTFNICVTNVAPVIACPAVIPIYFAGDTVELDVNGTDADGGPHPLIFNLVSTNAPGTVTVNPATGELVWPTGNASGTFNFCVSVSDSANTCSPCSPSNADTCCFSVVVYNNALTIEKVHNQLQGEFTEVSITMNPWPSNNYPMGGFDLLIKYDNSALSFISATEGQFLIDCGWEFFEYRFGANGNCGGSGCPSGFVRVVAMAETNNGANHPDCYVNGNPSISNELVVLKFLVTNDRTLECQYVPIQFWWFDCGDNTLSSVTGDTLLISKKVFNYGGEMDTFYQVDQLFDGSFPTGFGAASCDTFHAKGSPVRAVDFYNGGVDIICADSIDARGDINLNGISYEIADAVMFTKYFISGLGAFLGHADGSVAASDVNADGVTLSVADLVYLIGVIVGDKAPMPKLDVASVNVQYSFHNGVMSVEGNTEMGGAFVVVKGNVVPTLLASNMEMAYEFDGTNTRILVYPGFQSGQTTTSGFTGSFLQFQGEVISSELATVAGVPVVGKLIPKEFALSQNYPNPFNPTTKIDLALPQAGEYTLTVYNVNGQVVRTFDGSSEAGYVTIEWDASNLASGVYFYKLNAGSFSKTMKAILLK